MEKELPNLTQATLSKQLRMMEVNGLLLRTVYNQLPPKVEYSLSDLEKHFKPVLDVIEVWGTEYIDFLRKSKS